MTGCSNYERRNWYSQSFYSGPGGYKLCLRAIGDGLILADCGINVGVYLMRGEYDERLVWPFRGKITVQVVNQSNDQKHQEWTFLFNDKSAISSCSRVTLGERAKIGCMVTFVIHGFRKQYIKDDYVIFRVTKVLVGLL